eukprot:174263-Pyramimonas_sp.AAC.1
MLSFNRHCSALVCNSSSCQPLLRRAMPCYEPCLVVTSLAATCEALGSLAKLCQADLCSANH